MKRAWIRALAPVLVIVLLFAAYQAFRFPAAFRRLSDHTLRESEVSRLKEEVLAKESPQILVAYFSYSGTTKRVAEELSGRLSADLFEIVPKEAYSNVYTESNMEIRRGTRPELSASIENMEEYDIVFVGYPVWFHATPAPVNSFLESYDLTGKLVIPFCTSGGSGIEETMPTFLDSCEGLAVYGGCRLNGTGQIDGWLEEMGLTGEQGAFDASGVTWKLEVSDALRQTGNSDEAGNTSAPELTSHGEVSYETVANDEMVYPYETRELYAQRGENRIYGRIYIPQNAGEIMPTVIFSHGFGGNYQVGVPYAEALAQKGYAAYCFDFCGGSPDSRSGGSTLEMSVLTEQEDLEAVLRMIQEQPFVDRENIFLMGTSMGGAVSAITAAAHEEEIRGAVLLYPAFIMEDSMKERFNSAEEIPDTFYHLWMTVGRVFAEDLLDYDMYGAASGYGRDVLLLHGDADDIVPLPYSEKAVEVYPSAELHVLPGTGHGFYGEDFEQALNDILEYLHTHQTKTEQV